eukprot:gene36772-biopygen26238
MGGSKDFPMKPKPLKRKRNGYPNVADTLMIYFLPSTPAALSVSTLMGPIANLTAKVDYLTWLGGGSSPWNDLPPSPSMNNMTGYTVTSWTPSTTERPTAATIR